MKNIIGICKGIFAFYVFFTLIAIVNYIIDDFKSGKNILKDIPGMIRNSFLWPFDLLSSKEKRSENDRKADIIIKIIMLMACIGFLSSIISLIPSAKTTIGGLFENGEYTALYYVQMYPEGSKDKNYYIPAQIHSTIYEDEDGSYRSYYIDEAFFSNGGIVTFYKYGDEALEIGKHTGVTDDDNVEWEIVLTTQRAH